jgi:cytoskeletal protein CcmA (bactofilin family)
LCRAISEQVELYGRSVSEVRKGMAFRGCFDLLQAPRVNASWSLPPGADSIHRKSDKGETKIMWSKQQQLAEVPGVSPAPKPESAVTPFSAPSTVRSSNPAPRSSARLGSSLQIKGQITGTEDLQIDGIVEGAISLRGHELTVGSTAQLKSEIDAREVVVYGKVIGNLHARERVDVKKDGSVVGDIATARITIEDGAQFKGRIEIDPSKSSAAAD